jgi:hypothetical protein
MIAQYKQTRHKKETAKEGMQYMHAVKLFGFLAPRAKASTPLSA